MLPIKFCVALKELMLPVPIETPSILAAQLEEVPDDVLKPNSTIIAAIPVWSIVKGDDAQLPDAYERLIVEKLVADALCICPATISPAVILPAFRLPICAS